MSMRADYIKERLGDETIEHAMGYAEYRYLNENQVYIVDIYVKPEAREIGIGGLLADEICAKASKRGCREVIGTVNPSAKHSTESLKTLLAYGMHLKSASENLIVMGKEL